MFFGKLLPREGNFFEMFNQHADKIVEAARAFSLLVANYADPHLRERDMLIRMPGPPGGPADVPAVRMPVLFGGVAPEPEKGAPRLGQHNAEVIADPAWLSAKTSKTD